MLIFCKCKKNYDIKIWCCIAARCTLGYEEQNEWYFFSHKDRKYPTGTRTNRATAAGFWKATGRDKAVLSKNNVIGMRKTLVYYKGRAPNGRKSDWIMHEYRLQNSEVAPVQVHILTLIYIISNQYLITLTIYHMLHNRANNVKPSLNGLYIIYL